MSAGMPRVAAEMQHDARVPATKPALIHLPDSPCVERAHRFGEQVVMVTLPQAIKFGDWCSCWGQR